MTVFTLDELEAMAQCARRKRQAAAGRRYRARNQELADSKPAEPDIAVRTAAGVLVSLRETLAAHRSRGAKFDDVWQIAVQAAIASERDNRESSQWQKILSRPEQREAWRAAYERTPAIGSPAEAIRNLLAVALDDAGERMSSRRLVAS